MYSEASRLSPTENSHNARDVPYPVNHQVHRNRMDRPPYSLANPDKPFNAAYTGSCFCGKVEYKISCEQPLDAKFCHCPTCQRLHGAPFQWAAILHKTNVHFTKGCEQLIYWHPGERTQEYLLPCKVSCGNCRTPIMDEGRNMLLMFPTLIHFSTLAEKRKWYPTCHIFYSRRAMDVRDGLPKWDKHKSESNLIPEVLEDTQEKTVDEEVG